MTPEILSEPEWEHWFNLLCRADGLDGLYTAEEKLQLHERALRADRDRLAARVAEVEQERDEAEDFRSEIAIDAFTAPDAAWDTILDSLRSRIRDLGSGDWQEEARRYAANADYWRARLAEVRQERDDLETSMAVVAEGFEHARARVVKLEAALRALRALMEHPYYASREALDQWMSMIDAALDVAMSISNAHPDSDQPPVPERTTGEQEHPDQERWPGTTERPWVVEGLTAMDRFRSRVILFVGDSDQDRADLAMIVEAVNAYSPSPERTTGAPGGES